MYRYVLQYVVYVVICNAMYCYMWYFVFYNILLYVTHIYVIYDLNIVQLDL